MTLPETIVTYITKSLIEHLFKENVKEFNQSAQDNQAILLAHVNEVARWSERIQFYGMSAAESTDESTIKLRLESVPRRFRGLAANSIPKTEDSLLLDHNHYILLGDPGSGKTTTLKRLARKMLLEPPASPDDSYQYPIVVRLREMEQE